MAFDSITSLFTKSSIDIFQQNKDKTEEIKIVNEDIKTIKQDIENGIINENSTFEEVELFSTIEEIENNFSKEEYLHNIYNIKNAIESIKTVLRNGICQSNIEIALRLAEKTLTKMRDRKDIISNSTSQANDLDIKRMLQNVENNFSKYSYEYTEAIFLFKKLSILSSDNITPEIKALFNKLSTSNGVDFEETKVKLEKLINSTGEFIIPNELAENADFIDGDIEDIATKLENAETMNFSDISTLIEGINLEGEIDSKYWDGLFNDMKTTLGVSNMSEQEQKQFDIAVNKFKTTPLYKNSIDLKSVNKSINNNLNKVNSYNPPYKIEIEGLFDGERTFNSKEEASMYLYKAKLFLDKGMIFALPGFNNILPDFSSLLTVAVSSYLLWKAYESIKRNYIDVLAAHKEGNSNTYVKSLQSVKSFLTKYLQIDTKGLFILSPKRLINAPAGIAKIATDLLSAGHTKASEVHMDPISDEILKSVSLFEGFSGDLSNREGIEEQKQRAEVQRYLETKTGEKTRVDNLNAPRKVILGGENLSNQSTFWIKCYEILKGGDLLGKGGVIWAKNWAFSPFINFKAEVIQEMNKDKASSKKALKYLFEFNDNEKIKNIEQLNSKREPVFDHITASYSLDETVDNTKEKLIGTEIDKYLKDIFEMKKFVDIDILKTDIQKILNDHGILGDIDALIDTGKNNLKKSIRLQNNFDDLKKLETYDKHIKAYELLSKLESNDYSSTYNKDTIKAELRKFLREVSNTDLDWKKSHFNFIIEKVLTGKTYAEVKDAVPDTNIDDIENYYKDKINLANSKINVIINDLDLINLEEKRTKLNNLQTEILLNNDIIKPSVLNTFDKSYLGLIENDINNANTEAEIKEVKSRYFSEDKGIVNIRKNILFNNDGNNAVTIDKLKDIFQEKFNGISPNTNQARTTTTDSANTTSKQTDTNTTEQTRQTPNESLPKQRLDNLFQQIELDYEIKKALGIDTGSFNIESYKIAKANLLGTYTMISDKLFETKFDNIKNDYTDQAKRIIDINSEISKLNNNQLKSKLERLIREGDYKEAGKTIEQSTELNRLYTNFPKSTTPNSGPSLDNISPTEQEKLTNDKLKSTNPRDYYLTLAEIELQERDGNISDESIKSMQREYTKILDGDFDTGDTKTPEQIKNDYSRRFGIDLDGNLVKKGMPNFGNIVNNIKALDDISVKAQIWDAIKHARLNK